MLAQHLLEANGLVQTTNELLNSPGANQLVPSLVEAINQAGETSEGLVNHTVIRAHLLDRGLPGRPGDRQALLSLARTADLRERAGEFALNQTGESVSRIMSGEGDLGEMRDLLRTPLVRVAVLGMLVAAAILIAKGPPTVDAERRVVITGGDLMQLRAAFMRTWQREPTADELRGSLEQHIRQEVLYREALARGYDRDDQVVRRAMQQKMEFLAASQALQQPPSEEEIEAFFSL